MIYVFDGPDEYLKTKNAKHIIEQYVPASNRDFGLEVIEARCNKCEETLSVLNQAKEGLFTASFFGGCKVVWLRNANFLSGGSSPAIDAQEAKDAVSAFIKNLQTTPLPDEHHLIITTERLLGTSDFAKWVAKCGKITKCGEAINSYNLERVGLSNLKLLLKDVGLSMSPSVQAAFIQKVGADTWTLLSELEKLKTYIGEPLRDVTLTDLAAITASIVEGDSFDLIKALQVRSPLQVAEAVDRLRANKKAAFPVAVMVLNTLNDWCAIADAVERRWLVNGQWKISLEHVPARLQRLNDYALKKTLEGVHRYSLSELRAARHYVVEMRFKLVDTTKQEPWAIVEPTLLRIVASRKTTIKS